MATELVDNFDWDNVGASGFGGNYSADERARMEEMYGDTLTTVQEEEVIKGTVVGITDRDVILNIGWPGSVMEHPVERALRRIVTCGAGVPQRQRGNAIRVNVLGGSLQLRERGERISGFGGLLVIDLQQHSLIRLHNERSGSNAQA